MNQEIFQFFKKAEIFRKFSNDEIEYLISISEKKKYDKNDWIMKEGDVGDTVFLLYSGSVEIVRSEDEAQIFKIDVLVPGEIFGEMAHIEGEMRSASIKALEDVEAFDFHLEKIKNDPERSALYYKLIDCFAKKVSERLRKTGSSLINTLKEKLQILQTHDQISQGLIHLFIMIAFWFNLANISNIIPYDKEVLDAIFAASFIALLGISSFIIIKKSPFPKTFFGLTTKNWFLHSVQACLYSIPVLIFLIFLKWVLITNVQKYQHFSLLWSPKPEYLQSFLIGLGIYILLVPIQELVARGILQGSFRQFFRGPDRVILAIITSNLIFETFHTVRDFWFALSTFFLGVFWGILYEQQKSIIGVSVSHALIGGVTFGILDYQSLMYLT